MIDSLRVVGLLMGPNTPTILELRSSLVPPQPNRILFHKPTRIRLVIPEEVVMQPRLTVAIMVFSGGRVGEQFRICWFPISDDFYVNLFANLSEVVDLVRLTVFLNK